MKEDIRDITKQDTVETFYNEPERDLQFVESPIISVVNGTTELGRLPFDLHINPILIRRFLYFMAGTSANTALAVGYLSFQRNNVEVFRLPWFSPSTTTSAPGAYPRWSPPLATSAAANATVPQCLALRISGSSYFVVPPIEMTVRADKIVPFLTETAGTGTSTIAIAIMSMRMIHLNKEVLR